MTLCGETQQPRPLWERPELRQVSGDTLRPGGLVLTECAARFAGLAPGWRVLDVGAGLGASANHLRTMFGAKAMGLERSSSQLHQRIADIPMTQGDATALPFANHSLEMLLCECVFSLLPSKEQVMAEFSRVLVPGGWLALSDLYLREQAEANACVSRGCAPAPLSQTARSSHCAQIKKTSNPCPQSCADNALSEAQLCAQLSAAGFEIRLFEDHTRLLKELAARLILSGTDTGCAYQPGLGYCLIIAQLPGETPCSTTPHCA